MRNVHLGCKLFILHSICIAWLHSVFRALEVDEMEDITLRL